MWNLVTLWYRRKRIETSERMRWSLSEWTLTMWDLWVCEVYRVAELQSCWQGRSLCPNQCLRLYAMHAATFQAAPKVTWLSKNFPFLSSSTPASIKRVVFAFIVHSVAGWDKKVQSTFSLYWVIRGCQIVSRPPKSVKGIWSLKGRICEMICWEPEIGKYVRRPFQILIPVDDEVTGGRDMKEFEDHSSS